VKITVDTNVLVRACVEDEPEQAILAIKILRESVLIAITLPCLCEFVWVLRRAYKLPNIQIAETIRKLINAANVVTNRPAVEAGILSLEAGGDFADAVIAIEGQWLGGTTFVSFDKQATTFQKKHGYKAILLKKSSLSY
jgi:predicted nucleic-acid-binding protein